MSVALPPGRFSGLLLKVNAFPADRAVAGGGLLGPRRYKQGWFVRQSVIHFVTPNALGINKGMPVKLHGFTIGSVSEMQLAPAASTCACRLATEYLMRIPQDSQARHAREAA